MKYKEVAYNEAIKIMEDIKKETEDVGIFTDRGWGDDPSIETAYDIVRDGHGSKPIAWITKETFDLLIKNKEIGENILQTYKARTFHLFRPKEELKGE